MNSIRYLDPYEFDNEVSGFVEREVVYCVSSLMYELRSVAEQLDDYDEYNDLVGGTPDYEEAARQAGWDEIDGQIVKRPKFDEDYDLDDLSDYAKGQDDCTVEIAERGPAGGICTIDDRVAWQGHFDGEPVGDFYVEKEDCWREIVDANLDVLRERYEKDYQDEADDWADACSTSRVDPEYREVFEHWIVTNWLGRKLVEHGETVRDYLGMTIWGRCTTGQSISMDHVIQTIASETLDIKLAHRKAA